jgi:hypothetical protein
MWKNMVEPERPQMTHTPCMLDKQGYTLARTHAHTHRSMWYLLLFHGERASLLRCTYIALRSLSDLRVVDLSLCRRWDSSLANRIITRSLPSLLLPSLLAERALSWSDLIYPLFTVHETSHAFSNACAEASRSSRSFMVFLSPSTQTVGQCVEQTITFPGHILHVHRSWYPAVCHRRSIINRPSLNKPRG